MNISQMSDGTLHSHTLKILNRIEDILSRPCTQSDSHICRTIADELGYSLSYVRDIFKISTGISIRKYITRRRYTIIVSSYSADEFCQLKMHETIQGVKNFKLKVFREFPMLKSTYTQDVLQPPIEEDALSTSIDRAYETQMLSEVFDDITENRNLFEILDGEETILLQDLRDVFVDLDNIYFKYRDIVFKIIASVYVKEAVYRDYHASALFGLPLYSYSPQPYSTTKALQELILFRDNTLTLSSGFDVHLEWADRHRFGVANLVSYSSYTDDVIDHIEFVEHPFLNFDKHHVYLDLSFFNHATIKSLAGTH